MLRYVCFVGKESWLMTGLVDSFIASHTQACVELIATANEPHDKVRLLCWIQYVNVVCMYYDIRNIRNERACCYV